MSLTYGFFNSLNGDRKYDAAQISSIFDGIIVDGVFASIGTAFVVKAAGGLSLNVGVGRAWFNHTWTLNDSVMTLEADDAEVMLNRIDAVVLEVNAMESVRANSIKILKGTPASTPSNPTLTKSGGVYQYPLCYIYRKLGTTEITQADITNMVGSSETPFVTGILQTISLNDLLGQWEDEMNRFLDDRKADIDDWIANEEGDFTTWSNGQTNDVTDFVNTFKADLLEEQKLLDEWTASEQDDFLSWYNTIKGTLSGDVAGNLQNEIDKNELRNTLLTGFDDGDKTFSDDGTVIVSTAGDGRTITKTFTNNFLTATTVLRSAEGAEQACMVKTFSADGKAVSTTVTYY